MLNGEKIKTLAGQAAISIHDAQLYEQAVSVNRAKYEFLSVMPHELRTPLSITMGYTGMMKEGLLGGKITGENEVSEGTTFTVTIPYTN
jgi:signal transduction histidine kinase